MVYKADKNPIGLNKILLLYKGILMCIIYKETLIVSKIKKKLIVL